MTNASTPQAFSAFAASAEPDAAHDDFDLPSESGADGAPLSSLAADADRGQSVGLSVPVGAPLPDAARANEEAEQALSPANFAHSALTPGQSAIAFGMRFQGNAVIQGGCVIAGSMVGNVAQADGAQVSVTITDTGHIKGDIKAHQIIVMGQSQGLLDASSGTVTLHESSNVQGHVRYAKLQVNGAELNATLEKATASSDKSQ